MGTNETALAPCTRSRARTETYGTDWFDFYERAVRPRLTITRVFGDLRGARIFGSKLRAPCPLHQGRNRNFVVDIETGRWFCHSQCSEGGGPLEFVHRANGQTGKPRGQAFVKAVKELASRCGIAPPHDGEDHDELRRDAERMWQDALTVTSDAGVARWLADQRNLDPELLAAHDLARVVVPGTPLPRWAGYLSGGRWHSWPDSGYRVLVPLVDAYGRISSMRFRKPSAGTKGRSATGVSGIGLIMADAIARQVLSTRCAPAFWSDGPFSIVIAEGEPDFWSWATEPARRGLGYAATAFPAAIGVVSGSFNAAIASRLPEGTHVISAMDHDRGGDQIHARLTRVLTDADRAFALSRWSPP